MQRVQAFEFNDLNACPAFVRDSIVEVLGEGLRWAGVYESVADTWLEFVDQAGADTILDLCSGSGEPAAALAEACRNRGAESPRMVLTDLFPNRAAMSAVAGEDPETLDFEPDSVDATAIPAHLDYKACSIICAFHHFPPELAQAIINEQVENKRAVFILECLPRELLRVPGMMATLLPAYFANPWRTREDRLRKFVATYAIPAVALLGAWDSVISALRSYDESEYRAMAEAAGGDYTWTYREIPFVLGGKAVAFYGIPNQRSK